VIDLHELLAQVQRAPRVNGYVAPSTETRLSPIDGLGLFAKRAIRKGAVVAAWGGRVTTAAEIRKLPKDIGFHYALELYPGFYLAERSVEELDSADFINHSCRPNCRISGRFVLVARRDIKKDEELTANFSSRKQTGRKFACRCGAKGCKGVVHFD
jgi:SET domain-containing protein